MQVMGILLGCVLFWYVLFNVMGLVYVVIVFGIVGVIFIEVSFFFIGIGIFDDVVIWGLFLCNVCSSVSVWWLVIFFGLVIFVIIIIFNLLGEVISEEV